MTDQLQKNYTYIADRDALGTLLDTIKDTPRIAMDVEADSLHHYFEKVCLIQLAAEEKNYIIDPLNGLDLSDFFNAISAKTLILHGADYDLRMLHQSLNFRPRGMVFDTMIAAQLLGYKTLGLAGLIEMFFNVAVSKAGQKSDWSKRPLTEAQLDYASTDTYYLIRLADRLAAELENLGRLQWHTESCQKQVQSTGHLRQRDNEQKWKIKGAGTLPPRQQAFLREIWQWRDNEARKADVPPFKIMNNSLMLELAVWASLNRHSLSHGPRLPRTCQNERLNALDNAITKARKMPKSDWPQPRISYPAEEGLDPQRKALIESLRQEGIRIANSLGLEPQILAGRAVLTSIVANNLRDIDQILSQGLLMRWQADLLAPAIHKLLAK